MKNVNHHDDFQHNTHNASIQNKNLLIGIFAVAASFVQLIGYGTGFLRAWWQRCMLGKDEFSAFSKSFYK